MTETDAALKPIIPGIYHISVAHHGPGAVHHERLTAGPHLTISPASVHPDPKQEWQVNHGRIPGTITIARPGNIRPPLSITFKGDHAHPKAGDKLVLQREPFSTDWFRVPVGPHTHRFFIVVPPFPRPHGAEAPVSNDVEELDHHKLGWAIAPEKIHPPFLEIDTKDKLEWVFEFLRPHSLDEAEAEAEA